MSRIAKAPVELPKGVEFKQEGNVVTLKGGKGELSMELNSEVELTSGRRCIEVAPRSGSRFAMAITGTMRSLLANMAQGVSEGFERKLELVGVGYRAQAQGKNLNLSSVSRIRSFTAPEGISIETPSQTEVLIKGTDKQSVGQVAAEIRRFRPPEPYKGKGVRYADERVVLKEAKKK